MWLVVVASLVCCAFAAVPVDLDCVDEKNKTTPAATVCEDKIDSATCLLVFDKAVTAGDRSDKCNTPGLKDFAVENCPKTCGFCCKTPEYDCDNKPYAESGLNCTTMADKCKDTAWLTIIAQYCPNTCGLCDQGGCVDKATGCASEPTICWNVNFVDWAKENCARTCKQCPPAGQTTVAPGATTKNPTNPSNCVDTNPSCVSWAKNGKFCTNAYYQDKWNECRKSCGKC